MKTMPFTRIATAVWMLFALLGFSACSSAETVGLYFDPATPQIAFAAGDIKAALEKQKHTVQTYDLATLAKAGPGKKIVLATAADKAVAAALSAQGGKPATGLGAQAYALRTTTKPDLSYWVVGGDAAGGMYGGLQIAENISVNGFGGSYDSEESPLLMYRGMKLNLPLDKRVPTYVGGWSSYSAREAIPDVWDMTYWKTLIDQQARSRYNLLSVWVHHPFPALVKVADYPKACLPDIQRYDGSVINLNHEQRVAFWREVMRYAHDRGMKFYFFNWNVYVDYASTQYPVTRDQSDTNTIDYTYKSMLALLETYPELDGWGISGGDGMEGSTEEKTHWTWSSMGKAVYDYCASHPSRQFNLIHRALGTSPTVLNDIYAPLKSLTNVTLNMSAKYAMAHMYSTPAPRWADGDINGCFKLGLQTYLTIRNDDYFYFNWGDPKFVRDFITAIPRKETTVIGMYIGIDGYNPTRARLHKDPSLNGQLEVERRWFMEMLWGRLSYNTNTSDQVLNNLLRQRYNLAAAPATKLFNAWALASRSLPKVTELVMDDWKLDFHWYPEGCWSDPGRCSGFRTIDDIGGAKGGFAGQNVANGSSLCSIADSAAGNCKGKKSSYELADEMQADAANALSQVSSLESGGNADLQMAINNVKQMACLSRYYAHKIRGATHKKAGNTAQAREEMGKAYCWWMAYSRSMDETYHGDSFRNVAIVPDWKFADGAVLKEYTDLGGVGIPDCENMFTLTTSGNNGSISLEPSGGIYAKGAVVGVKANPDFGYAFGNWSGDLTGKANPTTITMNKKKKVMANFVRSTDGDPLPWVETFTMADGTKAHGAPTSWLATRPGGLLQVSGSRLMINGAGDAGVFETAEINISGRSVKASLEVQAGGGSDSGDYVRFYKIVDGGRPEQIGHEIKGGFTGTQVLEGSNITGKTLKLRIAAKVSASDEYFYFDNLRVE